MNIKAFLLQGLLIIMIFPHAVKGQAVRRSSVPRASVKGKILDSANSQVMTDATITVHPMSGDSSSAVFAIADTKGAFQIKGLSAGRYKMMISFEGYRHIEMIFLLNGKDLDLGTFKMRHTIDALPEVFIEKPPMRIKKDTVEYNASSYTVKPNAVVEDQLKKLPGVQVDASGNITAQGEQVTRVLVNGKRFFTDDPKLATRNLPPEMIETYQIFDDVDDQSKFSGFDDGNRIKTLNIITRKDRRQGYFGRAVAGAGTDQTYDESYNFHRFENDRQISLLGQANDINKQNFTAQDILGSSGSRRGSGGGPSVATNQMSPGITTVWASGINYRDNWGHGLEGYGSYFYNWTHASTATQSLTEKFFADSSNMINSNNSGIARTGAHRVAFNIESHADSADMVVFRPNIVFQTSQPQSVSQSGELDQDGDSISNSNGNNNSKTHGFNVNGSNLTYRHRFGQTHRTLTFDITGTVNINEGDGYNNANNEFYKLDSMQLLKQYYQDSLYSVSLSPTISYTEPLSAHTALQLSYNHSYNRSYTVGNTYDFSTAIGEYSEFDSLFSNTYRFLSNSDRLTLSWRGQEGKLSLNLGTGVQLLRFNSLNTTKDIDVDHDYLNFTPTVSIRYSFTSRQRLQIYYMGRTGTPTASQLQPLTTTTDNINYTLGNPDLKPQFTHSIRMLFSSYEPSSQRVIFATVNASAIVDDIQNTITPNLKGGETTSFVNLNGTYTAAGYFNYGFALRRPKSNLNLIANINYAQSQNLLDTSLIREEYAHDYTHTTGLSGTVSWTSNIKKNFDMNLSAASNYTIARNSLRPSQNLDYFSEVIDGEFTAYTNSGWLIASAFTYTYTDNQTPGYNASVPLWSPSIAKELFKKKNGEIRLSLFDALNKNTSVSKSVTLNQVTDTRTEVLSRYLMMSFIYNLNNFSGNGQKRMPGVFPRGMRGGGGGFRNNQ